MPPDVARRYPAKRNPKYTLDRPLSREDLSGVVDEGEVERLSRLGLVVREQGALALTARGRFLGGGVTARLLA